MGWVVNATPRPLYPGERDSIPIIQETKRVPGRMGIISSPPGLFFFSLSVLYLYFFVLIVLAMPFVLYCTTHTTKISMPPAGFEPAIPASDRPQTLLVLDRSVTEMGAKPTELSRPTQQLQILYYEKYAITHQSACACVRVCLASLEPKYYRNSSICST